MKRKLVIFIIVLLHALLLTCCASGTDLPAQTQTAAPPVQSPAPEPSAPPESPSPDASAHAATADAANGERPLLAESDYANARNYGGEWWEILYLNGLTIESFDFLLELDNLRSLDIRNCTIPPGVVFPQHNALTRLTISNIAGQDETEFVVTSLPLPNLVRLTITIDDSGAGVVLPKIPSLDRIIISSNNPIEYVANNNQISALVIEATLGLFDLHSLDGLETFTELEQLNVGALFSDLSALAECHKLEYLDISDAKAIDTLNPLVGLQNLETIYINGKAYYDLPQEDRDHFRIYDGTTKPAVFLSGKF